MPSEKPVRTIDARSLRALAHPLRVRMLDSLRLDGPATSSRLAEEFGENTGTVSWHLRNLAEHGFIEEDVDRGTKRERWWRAVEGTHVLHTSEMRKDPEARGAVDVYLQELVRESHQKVVAYISHDWSAEWEQAGLLGNWDDLRLTPTQLKALNAELMSVILKHYPPEDAEPAPGSLPVSVQLQSFPRQEGRA
ncbi:winged helix-turn-helix domain-containing protein [Streptomyces beijiangensis]|uniref:Helix-turn-helix transcriptional regulator n=1 Tax=Streptomyces beijiangensis TaxID=163361 RepID=A0A939FFG4_9ACTN|nr:winged helix-turn-helix domain-containing protein [Streptomyces beijiangensis]MBO0516432.1 helix-turn-helix transcriptional regulator [Streptomyces beijiangensis]